MTTDQPSAPDSVDALSDDDDDNPRVVSDESDGDYELEQLLTDFYAD
ncbi:hypothetical protein [Halorussus lipolyticus]|nr:hypothetical protein [Halorussus sp. DT80]